MSTKWFAKSQDAEPQMQVVHAPGFPPPEHPAEADVFARHEGVPGHRQESLADARIFIIGAGGLGSWTALALARSGARHLTIADHDTFDRTNASRQLMFADDVRRSKAISVANNIAPHMVAGGTITALWGSFDEVLDRYAVPADVLIVLVDNNACRLAAARAGRKRRIPVVFSMLSLDSVRINTFLQGQGDAHACLLCALPNLDPERAAPCASAVITSCFLSAAHTTFFVHRALMGWPDGVEPFNWRATDLLACEPERTGCVVQRPDCSVCGDGLAAPRTK